MRIINVTFLGILIAFAKAIPATAQSELENLLTDLVVLSDRYVEPAAQASVTMASAGWYTTAQTKELFKVGLSFHANGLIFPNSKKKFTITNEELRSLRIRGGTDVDIPTTLGGAQRTFFDFDFNGDTYEFQAFEGIDTGFLAYPYMQARVGLWQETELVLRYSPAIKIDKSSYAIYGVGLKHNLGQYLFKGKRPFDLSILASYSLFDLNLKYAAYELRSADNPRPLAVLDGAIVDAHAMVYQLVWSKTHCNWAYTIGGTYNRSWIDYRLDGEDGFFLGVLNQVLTILSETQENYQLDLGVVRQFNHWDVHAQMSYGEFINLNIGTTYHL